MIKEVPFFKNVHSKVVEDIVVQLQVELYLKGDLIVNKEDFGDCMYFIYTGEVEVCVPRTNEDVVKAAVNAHRDSLRGHRGTMRNSLNGLMAAVVGVGGEGGLGKVRRTSAVVPVVGGGGGGGNEGAEGGHTTQTTLKSNEVVDVNGAPIRGAKKAAEAEKKPAHSGSKVVATLKAGQYFGEVALILQGKRTASIRAKGACELCVLTRDMYDFVASQYPDDAIRMRHVILSKYGAIEHARNSVNEAITGKTAEERKAFVAKKTKKRDDKMARKAEKEQEVVDAKEQLESVVHKFSNDVASVNKIIDGMFEYELHAQKALDAMTEELILMLAGCPSSSSVGSGSSLLEPSPPTDSDSFGTGRHAARRPAVFRRGRSAAARLQDNNNKFDIPPFGAKS